MKVCNVCRVEKPATEFHRRKASADGLCYTCKSCACSRTKVNFHTDRERHLSARRDRYAANYERERETRRAWRKNNLERSRAIVNAWRHRNPGRINALSAKRRAALIQRTPVWADMKAIAAIYERAVQVAALTGEPVHVDHDIPLQGKRVSGLHVAANLKIVHALENMKKHNRWEDS